MALLELAAGVGELSEWFYGAFAGWRYVFSRSYRRRVHARWRDEAWVYVAVDIICGIVTCAFSLFVLNAVISMFAGWDWWPRLFMS